MSRWRATYSPRVASGMLATSDGLIVIASGMAVYQVYVGWSPDSLPVYALATAFNLAATIICFYLAGLYNFEIITAPYRQFHKILCICVFVFLMLILIAFAFKVSGQFSRVWSFSSFLLETSLIILARMYAYFLIRKWARAGRLVRRIAVVGGGEQGMRLAEQLGAEKEPWIQVIGVYDDRLSRIPGRVGKYPVRGDLDDLLLHAREERIDDIIIALPWTAEDRVMMILLKLMVLPTHIRLSPDLVGHKFLNCDYNRIGNVSYLSLHEKPISDWSHVVKGVEDQFLASILLLLLLPLLGVIAVAIKLDSPGPALFRQKRYGFNNELFDVFKFRTMVHDRPPDIGSAQARQNDPRVTRLGKFLRRMSLDELPQLFNVLNGTMSLVGPRPLPIALVEEHAPFIDGYFARHRVKPGITGWAQVNGYRGETEVPEKMAKRFEYDVQYIDNWSVFYDLKILIMTVAVLFNNKNAY